jgi:hypothetical protein
MKYTYLKINNKYSISLREAICIISCLIVSIDLYSSSNIVRVITSRKIRWAGHVARMGGEACTGFWWENLRGKGLLWRHRRRWEYNIKMDIQEVRCGGVDWIELAQDRDK